MRDFSLGKETVAARGMTSMKRLALLVTLVCTLCTGAEAFVAPTPRVTQIHRHRQHDGPQYDSLPMSKPMSKPMPSASPSASASPRQCSRGFSNSYTSARLERRPLPSRSLLLRPADVLSTIKTRIKHTSIWTRAVHKRHLFAMISMLWVLPQRALAKTAQTVTTTAAPAAVTSQAQLHFHSAVQILVRNKRTILTTALSAFVVNMTVKYVRCKRRQAIDATSEWGRYARNPGARGRALLTLALVKVLPLWLLAQVVPAKQRANILQYSGRLLANGLIQLGALYIKLGQIISSREKLLPAEWITAMECLQDQVPAKSGKEALDLAYSAWPQGADDFERTFRDFDTTPVAAASLGQVHKAVINTGENKGDVVAIKLQRPFLREIYDQDLTLLTKVAAAVDKFGGSSGNVGGVSQSWTDIFKDAEDILYREIDYRDEAANGIRFCNDFGLTKGGKANTTTAFSRDGKRLPSAASWLRAPYVYNDLSSEKVLVMEFVPSIKINNNVKLAAANVTQGQREYLADCLGRAYLRQFCCNGFFSTDPHSGNLGVKILNKKEDPNGVQLVFYDFGQAATLTPNQADGILDIIEAIVDSDVDQSLEAFAKMGVLKEDANLEIVRAKVADNFKTGKVKANRKRLSKQGYKFKTQVPTPNSTDATVSSNSTATASSSNSTAVKDSDVMASFTLPAEYAFVGRALVQMDGVGKGLDPEFDFISAAAPSIYEIKGAEKYLKEEAAKWFDSFLPHYVSKEEQIRRRSERIQKNLEWRNKERSEWY